MAEETKAGGNGNHDPNAPEQIYEMKKCPHCGSERRFAQEQAEKLGYKGIYTLFTTKQPLIPQPIPTIIPVNGIPCSILMSGWDNCLECGKPYLVLVTKVMGVAGLTQGQPGAGGDGRPPLQPGKRFRW